MDAAFDEMMGQAPNLDARAALVGVPGSDHHIGTILVDNSVSNGNPNNVTFATHRCSVRVEKGATGDAHPLGIRIRIREKRSTRRR